MPFFFNESDDNFKESIHAFVVLIITGVFNIKQATKLQPSQSNIDYHIRKLLEEQRKPGEGEK